MRPNKKQQEQELNDYYGGLIAKFKQDPNWELQQEFGRLLMRHINSYTPQERARYDELKQILCAKPPTP